MSSIAVHGLVKRHRVIRLVELVEVDVIGLQTRQALIGRSQQIRTPEMSRQGLGREKDTITPPIRSVA